MHQHITSHFVALHARRKIYIFFARSILACSLGTLIYTPVALANSGITSSLPGGDSYTGVYINSGTANAMLGTVYIETGLPGVGSAYGSYVDTGGTGNAVSGSAYLSGGQINNAAGGVSAQGNVSQCSVFFSAGMATGSVYGGHALGLGSATNGLASVSGGNILGDVYAGASVGGIATGNRVTMREGTVEGRVYGGFGGEYAADNDVAFDDGKADGLTGGYSQTGVTSGNSVLLKLGIIEGTVVGGGGSGRGVDGNSVIMQGGTAAGLIGGEVDVGAGYVQNNTVEIISGDVNEVKGGNALVGKALKNIVRISGGSVTGNTYGGYSQNGAVTGNKVYLSGGTIIGDVYAGFSQTGSVTGNTVFLFATPNLDGATLYGGNAGGLGNTLSVSAKGLRAHNIHNFQQFHFFLPADVQTGDTMLTLLDPAGTSITNPKLSLSMAAKSLQPGETFTLLRNDAGFSASQVPATFLAQTSGSKLIPLYSNVTPTTLEVGYKESDEPVLNSQVKSLSEARVASLSMVNMGSELVAGYGIESALAAASPSGSSGPSGPKSSSGLAPFMAISGNDLRYNTGSHVDVRSYALMLGLAKSIGNGAVEFTAGGFVEMGRGSYTSHNNFENLSSVDADGNISYEGVGLLARLNLLDGALSGLYAEASARAGQLRYDYGSDDLYDPLSGQVANYDYRGLYLAMHGGLGYILILDDTVRLDMYGKYFWTHEDKTSETIMDESYSFDAVDSQRVRTGARVYWDASEHLTPYAGAAWEYEFSGEAKASVTGESIPAPSLKGSTGVGELGLTWKPSAAGPLAVDFGVQGHVGMREGVSGNLMLKFEF